MIIFLGNLLQRIWKFLSADLWEDWDAYLVIILSVVFGVLGIQGTKDAERIQLAIAAACGTMAVIAFSLLKDRSQRKLAVAQLADAHIRLTEPLGKIVPQLERLEKLPLEKILSHMRAQDSLSMDALVDYGAKDMEVIKSAKREVLIIQETASELASLQEELVALLKTGKKVRLLTASDHSAVVTMLSFRNEMLTAPEISERLQSASVRLGTVMREAGPHAANLVVRYLPYPTDVTAVFCDDESDALVERKALIRFQGFRIKLSEKPFILLSAVSSPALFPCFQQQARRMWASSIKCVLLTGPARVGKTTVLKNVAAKLRLQGQNIAGILMPEAISPAGKSEGVDCQSLATGVTKRVAKKSKSDRYDLDHAAIGDFVVPVLEDAIGKCDVLIVDGIASALNRVPEFKSLLTRIISSRSITILGSVEQNLAQSVRGLPGGFRIEIVPITETSRLNIENSVLSDFQLNRQNGS